jgi:hypothetical protein
VAFRTSLSQTLSTLATTRHDSCSKSQKCAEERDGEKRKLLVLYAHSPQHVLRKHKSNILFYVMFLLTK